MTSEKHSNVNAAINTQLVGIFVVSLVGVAKIFADMRLSKMPVSALVVTFGIALLPSILALVVRATVKTVSPRMNVVYALGLVLAGANIWLLGLIAPLYK
jgi:hypothetical protein